MILAVRFAVMLFFGMIFQTCSGYGQAKLHAQDMQAVFDGYNDGGLYRIYSDFSSDIDFRLKERIRARIQEMYPDRKIQLAKHRYYAHSWPFGAAIPGDQLMRMEKDFPGSKKEIIKIWGRFSGDWQRRICSEFGLQMAPHIGNAWAAMLYHIHLLGDLQPPPFNKDYDYVMETDKVLDNICKNCMTIFGKSSAEPYAKQVVAALKFAYSNTAGDEHMKAAAILKELKAQKIGTMLHKTFAPKYLNESRHQWTGEQSLEMKQSA